MRRPMAEEGMLATSDDPGELPQLKITYNSANNFLRVRMC